LRVSPFLKTQFEESYFFFLAAFLAGFLAAFFLTGIENHPLFKSHMSREVVQKDFDHCARNKFFQCKRQM
jgi:hypothetical protein